MDSMRLYATLNRHRLNQRAAGILTRPHFRWSPMTELAGLALIRHALERGVLDCHRAIAEPERLLARLEANPEQAIRLMMENALGDPFEIDDDPDEAARQILEEIIASIRAFPTESVAVGGGSCKQHFLKRRLRPRSRRGRVTDALSRQLGTRRSVLMTRV